MPLKMKLDRILNSFGEGNGHIFNLGHGILPDIEPENAKAMVQFVKEESKKFHKESINIIPKEFDK